MCSQKYVPKYKHKYTNAKLA